MAFTTYQNMPELNESFYGGSAGLGFASPNRLLPSYVFC